MGLASQVGSSLCKRTRCQKLTAQHRIYLLVDGDLSQRKPLFHDTKLSFSSLSGTSLGLLQTQPCYLKTEEEQQRQKEPILFGIFKTLVQTYLCICKYVTEPTGNNVQEITEYPVNYDKACDCSFETSMEVRWESCRVFFPGGLLLLLF